jgi:U11/U12 small nuclear ribonucleoprotein 31 kDa protein
LKLGAPETLSSLEPPVGGAADMKPCGKDSNRASNSKKKKSGNHLDNLKNNIRVSNISESTTEADLQRVFSSFGRTSRIYVVRDKETKVSRGLAFVSFFSQENAARTMERLRGYYTNDLPLKLEWV